MKAFANTSENNQPLNPRKTFNIKKVKFYSSFQIAQHQLCATSGPLVSNLAIKSYFQTLVKEFANTSEKESAPRQYSPGQKVKFY